MAYLRYSKWVSKYDYMTAKWYKDLLVGVDEGLEVDGEKVGLYDGFALREIVNNDNNSSKSTNCDAIVIIRSVPLNYFFQKFYTVPVCRSKGLARQGKASTSTHPLAPPSGQPASAPSTQLAV